MKYKIELVQTGNNKGRKSKKFNFKGTLVGQTKYFYIFKTAKGYLECFLKVDIKNGEYVLKEA